MSFEFYQIATWVLIVVVAYHVIDSYCIRLALRNTNKDLKTLYSSLISLEKRVTEERADRKQDYGIIQNRIDNLRKP